MRVIDYTLIGENLVEELAKKVKILLDEGWQPLGQPYATYMPDEVEQEYHFQALVKYE